MTVVGDAIFQVAGQNISGKISLIKYISMKKYFSHYNNFKILIFQMLCGIKFSSVKKEKLLQEIN